MVPASPASTASAAELRMFDRIRDDLSPDWIALHSVGLAIHEAKPWAEIDFLLIGPPGVFCIEVKGGLVSRNDGVWYTTPRFGPDAGKRRRLKESPFEQVGSASAALFKYLQDRVAQIANAITGYAVAAPDCEWTIRGPDVDRALVLDELDAMESLDTFMRRVTRRWSDKIGRGWNRQLSELGRRDKQQILDAVRGDFQLVPSLTAALNEAETALLRLTTEQAELFARLSTNDRVIASGGAGTGKTLIAVEEARRLADRGQRVLFVCFSRNLERFLAGLPQLASVKLRTLHGQMHEIVNESGRKHELPNASDEDLMTLFLPELAVEVLLDEEARFDAVVIDEAQDLLREAYVDVIEALIGGDLASSCWRLFLDPNQNMFKGVESQALERFRRTSHVAWPLTVNCRNTAPIATQVSLLAGVPLSPVLGVEGPDASLHWYSTPEEQRAAVSSTLASLRRDGLAPEQVVVLSRHRLDSSCASKLGGGVVDVSRGGIDTAQSGLRFSTVASFKGLEASHVLLVDVDDLHSDEGLISVYVGASRAKTLLHVFIDESQRARFGDLAREFGRTVAASG